MKTRHCCLFVLFLVPVLLFAQAVPYPVMGPAAQNRARVLFGYFDSGQSPQLFAAMSADMKKNTSAPKLAQMAREVANQLGHEEKLLGDNFAPDLTARNTIYARYSKFTKSKDPVFTLFYEDEQGQIALLQFRPMEPPPGNKFSDYKVTTKLHLPFPTEWFVYQGGPDLYQNSNAFRDAERYAMTFLPLKDGQPFSGDGTKNEQFYCYGQPVTAPADGIVVMVNDSYADNAPGHPEQMMPYGNRVLISHGHKEYSLLLHLKQNSVQVKSGDKVKQGDVVAECGNSGNSPVPHLEYRLQNSKGVPFPSTLPVQFVDYLANGKPVESGGPVRGQYVRNAADSTPSAPAEKK